MKKSFKERLVAQRYEKAQLRKRVLPLYAFYSRSAEFERRRLQFYTDLEKAFQEPPAPKKKADRRDGVAGRDGRPAELRVVGQTTAYTTIMNANPLEYLYGNGMLQGKQDAHGAARRRLDAGLRLRSIWEGAQISGLKAADWEGSSGGGVPGRLPGEHKMDCIRWLAELRGANETVGLAQSPFSIIEDIVYHDRWAWETVRPDRRERFMLKIHRALDELSVRLFMMTDRDFNARWHAAQTPATETGSPDPSRDRRRDPGVTPSQS